MHGRDDALSSSRSTSQTGPDEMCDRVSNWATSLGDEAWKRDEGKDQGRYCISPRASQIEGKGCQFSEVAAAGGPNWNSKSPTTPTYVLIRYGHRRSISSPGMSHQSSRATESAARWGGGGRGPEGQAPVRFQLAIRLVRGRYMRLCITCTPCTPARIWLDCRGAQKAVISTSLIGSLRGMYS